MLTLKFAWKQGKVGNKIVITCIIRASSLLPDIMLNTKWLVSVKLNCFPRRTKFHRCMTSCKPRWNFSISVHSCKRCCVVGVKLSEQGWCIEIYIPEQNGVSIFHQLHIMHKYINTQKYTSCTSYTSCINTDIRIRRVHRL